MNEDNWQHRSATMRCGFCIYFVPKGAPIAGLGRCRRHAPTLNGWPAVFVSDFCGDHKLDDVVLARAAAEQQSRTASLGAMKAATEGVSNAQGKPSPQTIRKAEAPGSFDGGGSANLTGADTAGVSHGKSA